MSSVVQNILDGVVGEGARSTKFECFINFSDPNLIGSERDIFALVKTSQFPGKSHDVIDLKFKGRNIPIKGQVKYDNTWTCTFYMTQDHELKKSMEDWIESLDQKHNVKDVDSKVLNAQKENNAMVGSGYATSLKIAQLDFDGREETIVYELHHAFPKSVSAVDVDYSGVGTITEVTVEFSYAYFDSAKSSADLTSVVDEIKSEILSEAQDFTDGIKKQIASAFNNLTGQVISAIASEFNSSEVYALETKAKMATRVDW